MELKLLKHDKNSMKARPPNLFYGSKKPRLIKYFDPIQKYDENSSLFTRPELQTLTENLPVSEYVSDKSSKTEKYPEKECCICPTLANIHETIDISSPVRKSSSHSLSTKDSDSEKTLVVVNESNIAVVSLSPIANNLNCDKSLYSKKTSIYCNNNFKNEESNSLSSSKLKSKQRTISSYFNQSSAPAKEISQSSPNSHSNNKNLDYSAKLFHQVLLKPCKTENTQITFTPFDLQLSPGEKRKSLSKKLTLKKCTTNNSGKEQTYIDLGQKNFGHVTCTICGMVYTKSQVDDETQHAKYHEKLVQKLKFPGWKNERVVQEFYDGRIILVKSSDNHLHQKKLLDIKDIVDTELGFTKNQNTNSSDQQVYLFISAKKIVGYAVALPISKAFPIILTTEISNPESACGAPTTSWCCSIEPVPAVCGISRIWVFSQNRRQNIATRIVDCIRHNFLYGCVISKNKIAFSDPTPDGRIFAEKYIEDPRILVFR
ncbi:N-acetyltransferase ESCO2 isoform X1 [Hydra vulgaris]|uniref:N-acetyltransferase ESCO2 n=1 Tax=Hydra vulgaris TaxID=6087 RepID=T2MCU2_HYDVU|nr:N-acetyltransferase ESCO2 isoform X1 [Hydra vulgaris]